MCERAEVVSPKALHTFDTSIFAGQQVKKPETDESFWQSKDEEKDRKSGSGIFLPGKTFVGIVYWRAYHRQYLYFHPISYLC